MKNINGIKQISKTTVPIFHKIVLIVIILIGFNHLFLVASWSMNIFETKSDKNHYYSYSGKQLSRYLTHHGYRDFEDFDNATWELFRNSEGTALRIINKSKRKAVVISCDGTIKEIDLPSKYVWINDANQVVAWLDDKNFRPIYYKDGSKGNPPFGFHDIEPGGRYFVKEIQGANTVDLFSIDNPNKSILKMKAVGSSVLKIFFKNNRLYVFDHDRRGLTAPLKAFIFEKEGDKFRQIDEFEIPRENKNAESAFYVEDMSPWNDEILLTDVYDFPSSSEWYLFNLKTREFKKIGNKKGYGFFLQCDVLKN